MTHARWIACLLFTSLVMLTANTASAQYNHGQHGPPEGSPDASSSPRQEHSEGELREPRDDGEIGLLVMQDGSGRPGFHGRMSEDEVESALDVVVALYPELADRLNQLKEDDPERLRQTLERRFPRVRFLLVLKQRDPAMYELRLDDIALERQTKALGKKIRQARADDDKDAYKKYREQLEELAAKHFDIRQAIRESEIEMLKGKIEDLEKRLDDRADDRKDLIEQRVEQVAGNDW